MSVRKAAKPRREPKQDRARETCAAIIDAAERILAQKKRSAMSLREIAREAAVPVSTVYDYYPDKESLLLAVEQRSYVDTIGAVRQRLEETTGMPIEERVIAIVEVAVRKLGPRFKLHGMTLEAELEGVPAAEERIAMRHGIIATIAAVLMGHEERIRVKDPHLAAAVAVAATIHTTRLLAVSHPEAMESGELPRQVGELVARYLFRNVE
jgi:AcrR family transcriptional regulator